MHRSHLKRSGQIQLVLLGVATLAASGCGHAPTTLQAYDSEVDCLEASGPDGCAMVEGGEEFMQQQWYLYDDQVPFWGLGLARAGGLSGRSLLFAQTARQVGRTFVHIHRHGFGHTAGRFGGSHS